MTETIVSVYEIFSRTHGVNLQGMNISGCTAGWTSAVELKCTSQGTPIELVDMAFWSNTNRNGAVNSQGCSVLVANSMFYNNIGREICGGILVVRMSDLNARILPKCWFNIDKPHEMHFCKSHC